MSVAELAKAVHVRKEDLASHMLDAGMATDGQQVPENRFQNRIRQTPIRDIVGIHIQRVLSNDLMTWSRVVAVAIASRGFPNTRSPKKIEDLDRGALIPSFISMDARRAWRFEMQFQTLMGILDWPKDPRIDETSFFEALQGFSGFGRQAGYEVEISVGLEGSLDGSLAQRIQSVPGCRIISWPMHEFMARIWWEPIVSRLGVGRFPLLGQTVERFESVLESLGLGPSRQFHLAWTPEDVDSAMDGRLRVCDALFDAGLLYGAPLNKIGEMAAEGESSFSRSIAKKSVTYGDGLHGKEQQRPETFVRLGVPARLKSRCLSQLSLDLAGSPSFIDFRTVDIEGKQVECVVAWLPSIRNMLLRALRNPRFNDLLADWELAQRTAIEGLENTSFENCFEILNPEGTIDLHSWRVSHPELEDTHITHIENLALGMVLSAYDADSLIGSLISHEDWRRCQEWQEKWNERVTKETRRKEGTILGRAEWENMSKASERLKHDLGMSSGKRYRLIRFILEEAAANFTGALRRTAPSLGIDISAGWPDESRLSGPESFSIIAGKTQGFWPVVGMRMDFFVARQSALLRKHLGDELKKQSEKGEVKFNEDFAKHSSGDDMSADYDPFEDDGQ